MESTESMDINVRAGDNKRAPDRSSAADDDSKMYNRVNDSHEFWKLQFHVSQTNERCGYVCSHGFCAVLEFWAVLELR